MKVEVLGPGCMRCHKVHEIMVTASDELQTDAVIEHVNLSKLKNPQEYYKLGIRITPAIIINGKVVMQGRIPSINEAKELLESSPV
jgi:glutaredoxin